MKIIIEFDHAMNDFEIDDIITELEKEPYIKKIIKIEDKHCGKCF